MAGSVLSIEDFLTNYVWLMCSGERAVREFLATARQAGGFELTAGKTQRYLLSACQLFTVNSDLMSDRDGSFYGPAWSNRVEWSVILEFAAGGWNPAEIRRVVDITRVMRRRSHQKT